NRDYPANVVVNGVMAPAPQRFDKISQEAIVAQPSVAAAFSVAPWLDVGARLSWGIGHVKTVDTIQGMPGPEAAAEVPDQEGQTTIEANDFFIPNGGIGVKARAGDNIEIGLAWNSAIPLHATGNISLLPGAHVAMPITGLTQELAPVPADQQRCHDP